MPRVAYLGPEGSFCEEAALNHFNGEAELVSFPEVAAAISAVIHRLVDRAVVPIENSLEGSVSVTLDQLIHAERAPRIVAEVNLPIHHQLVARPGVGLTEIERIVSIPLAAAQCRRFLLEHLPQAQILPALSTSAAVSSLVHAGNIAAIGNRRAARLYGMDIVAEDIEDDEDNVTRFVILGHERVPATGHDRTSICCTPRENVPGALLTILRPFSERDINLSKVESRPTRRGMGRYFFLIDLDGHEDDPAVSTALTEVRRATADLRVLGSYPAAPELGDVATA
ncbi:MAG: prephenate dehydratase [Candidatus Dormibacteria bacterium]